MDDLGCDVIPPEGAPLPSGLMHIPEEVLTKPFGQSAATAPETAKRQSAAAVRAIVKDRANAGFKHVRNFIAISFEFVKAPAGRPPNYSGPDTVGDEGLHSSTWPEKKQRPQVFSV
ncbi:hypothetical protein [Megalodesulfovibrio paquesii]